MQSVEDVGQLPVMNNGSMDTQLTNLARRLLS